MTKSAREIIAELPDADEIYDDIQKLERQIEELEDEVKALKILMNAARARKGKSEPTKKSDPKPKEPPSSADRKSQIEKLLKERGPLPFATVAKEIGYDRPGFMRNHFKDRRFLWDEKTDMISLRNGTSEPSPT